MIKNIFVKYKNLTLTAKAAVWFTLCNLLLKGISLISTPIFTRVMSEDEYGLLSIFMSYEQLILIFATWEIPLGAYQKGLFKYKSNVGLFTSSTQLLTNVITLVVFSVIFVFRDGIYELTGMSNAILILLFLYLLFQPAYSNWLIKKRTYFEYKQAVFVTLFYSILNIIAPLVALFMIDNTADIKFGSTLIISAVVFVIFYIQNMDYINVVRHWSTVKGYWKFLISFQAPLVLHSLSYLVLAQADRIMIGNMVGKAQAAYYSVAYNIASVVSIFQNSINQVLTPWRYKKLEEKKYDDIRKNTNYLLCAIGLLIISFILVAPEIMRILFTENYYEAVWSIPPISVSIYFMFLYSIFVNIETYFEKTKYVMYVSVSCGILNILLNYIFIEKFGYIVCGYTTLISYIAFAVGHYYFMRRVCRKELPGVKIFNINIIVLISAVLILLSVGITILYPYALIRYGIVILILAILTAFRKRIIVFLKQFKN